LVDQPGLFGAGNDLYGVAEGFAGARQELLPVARFTQRLRGDGTYLRGRKICQTLPETRQAIPAALHGLGREIAVFVETAAQADGFFAVFGALDVTVGEAADFETKAVGS
jgi:hypothetical protein